ncbi:MAG: hypothetical protein NT135_01190 [Candidatus Berkelbacteria bacterium]|nr:hypothetical protein [Candidatus Berkelbacteria bacterium]
MMDKLQNFNQILSPNPSFSFGFLLPFIIFFGLMLLLGVIIPILIKKRFKKSPPYRKLGEKIQSPILTFSIIGFILIFFGWQAIPYLSSRILLILLQLAFVCWLIYFLVYLLKIFPKEIANWHEELHKMKYLKKGARK